MRSRKRVWIGLGALCALALGIGWLARPEDELAGVMRFHPRSQDAPGIDLATRATFGATLFTFTASPREVVAAVPGHKELRWGGIQIVLPSGRRSKFIEGSSASQAGETCALLVCDDPRPWYQRAWSRMRYRLGL
ncbi:MAG: hypothetical protein ACHQ50_01820 [Fimbriimonadales bacterium]